MREALLIVDVQNDFLPGGALAVPSGDQVLDRIDALIGSDRFELVVATRDWHPPDHRSFEAQGGPWPVHCVAGTPGAEISSQIPAELVDVIVDKGTEPGVEGYSAFQQTSLEQILRERGIERLTVVGLATDYCVRASALDALGAGFEVTVDRAGVRGIDAEHGDSDRALAEIADAGGRIA